MINATFSGFHFIPWLPHCWEPYNIRYHKGRDDQCINSIPLFRLVDVKSLPTDSKDVLHQKNEHWANVYVWRFKLVKCEEIRRCSEIKRMPVLIVKFPTPRAQKVIKCPRFARERGWCWSFDLIVALVS